MLFAIGVLGAVIGSFVNVVSVREGKGEDFVHGRSYCPHCQHSLHAFDSFLSLFTWEVSLL